MQLKFQNIQMIELDNFKLEDYCLIIGLKIKYIRFYVSSIS